jgi:uncharacterized membrane protein
VRAQYLIYLFLTTLLVTAPARSAPFIPPTYTMQMLPGGASAISNNGWVAGAVLDAEGLPNAYRWRDGHLEVFADFGTGYFGQSSALAVNDNGNVVGTAGVSGERAYSGYSPAVLFGTGEPLILGVVSGADGNATGINNRGQICGTGYHDNLLFEAFIWEAGLIRPLPFTPEYYGVSQAFAINNAGQVVGWTQPNLGNPNYDHGAVAAIWMNGAAYSLTNPGEVTSEALDINDSGLAVGWIGPAGGRFQTPGTKFPVSWDTAHDGAAVPLAPGVQGTAQAINNAGLAVGNSASGWAVLFAAGQAFRLQSLVKDAGGWAITHATDINDSGQIVVRAFGNGKNASLLLTPILAARYVPPSGGR